VFAASPSGGGRGGNPGEPGGESWLLRTAKDRSADGEAAEAGETGRLLDNVASKGNMARALLHVARNKGAAGVDGRSVEDVVAHARRLLPRLRHELLEGVYQPGAIRRVWIPKPGGKGRRGLGIPNVMDRWVQQSVLQVLEPIFDPDFHASSHGFRPHRGTVTAITEAKRHIGEGYEWVVDIDLSNFFDRVNHQRLLSRLAQRIEDGRVLKLIHRMVKAKVVMPDGTVVTTGEGTPQGGPLSPLLSNVVLDELDWELQRRGHRFARYADDCNIYVRSQRAGERVMASIRRFIERRLRLKVNEEKSSVGRSGQLQFLGFRLKRTKGGEIEVYLSRRSDQRIRQKIRELTPRNFGSSLKDCMDRVSRYLRGWYGYFRQCTQWGARRFKKHDAHIRRRLRAIIIRQKGRRPRYLYRHLVSRGVRPGFAKLAAYMSRGVWKRSISRGIHTAYMNSWFQERLYSLWDAWQTEFDPVEVSYQQARLFAD